MKHITLYILLAISISTQGLAQLNWKFLDGPAGADEGLTISSEEHLCVFTNEVMAITTDNKSWRKYRCPDLDVIAIKGDTIVGMLPDLFQKYSFHFSTDLGKTWFERPLDRREEVRPWRMLLLNHGAVVMGEDGKMMMSTDFSNWEVIYTPTFALVKWIAGGGGELVIMTRDNRIYQTSDLKNWDEWNVPTNERSLKYVERTSQATVVLDEDGFIYSTLDEGETWTEYRTGVISPDNKLITNSDLIYFFEESNMWQSKDHGRTFTVAPLPYIDTRRIQATAFDESFFGFTDEFGFSEFSRELGGMLPVTSELFLGKINQMAYDGERVWMATTQGVHAYDPLTDTWTDPLLLKPYESYLTIDASADGTICTCDERNLHLSEDRGETWKSMELPWYIRTNTFGMKCMVRGPNIFLGTKSHFLLTKRSLNGWRDFDRSLSKYPSVVEYNGEYIAHIRSGEVRYATDQANFWRQRIIPYDLDDIMVYEGRFIGVDTRTQPEQPALYITTDFDNWERAGYGLNYYSSPTGGRIDFFRVDQRIYAQVASRLYYSDDNMVNWTSVEPSFVPDVHDYLETDHGVFRGWNGLEKLQNASFTKLESHSHEVKMFPNPSSGEFSIKANQTIASIRIFTWSGQLFKSYEGSVKSIQLPKGKYVGVIELGNGELEQEVLIVE